MTQTPNPSEYQKQLIEEIAELIRENSTLRRKIFDVVFPTLVIGILIGVALAVVFVKLPGC